MLDPRTNCWLLTSHCALGRNCQMIYINVCGHPPWCSEPMWTQGLALSPWGGSHPRCSDGHSRKAHDQRNGVPPGEAALRRPTGLWRHPGKQRHRPRWPRRRPRHEWVPGHVQGLSVFSGTPIRVVARSRSGWHRIRGAGHGISLPSDSKNRRVAVARASSSWTRHLEEWRWSR